MAYFSVIFFPWPVWRASVFTASCFLGVTPLDPVIRPMCERYFNSKRLFIETGVKTGMEVHYDNPAEVGADRIVTRRGFEKYTRYCIVVGLRHRHDFRCVSARRIFGGVICPGHRHFCRLRLFSRTARLPRVEIDKRQRVSDRIPWAVCSLAVTYGLSRHGGRHSRTPAAELGKEDDRDCHGRIGSNDWRSVEIIKTVTTFSREELRISGKEMRQPAAISTVKSYCKGPQE